MGREILRVPLDFDFPLGRSYVDHQWDVHFNSCKRKNHDKCQVQRTPPKGEGWQLWQTVSDGPISPVFASPEELIAWMTQPVSPSDDTYDRGGGGAYPRFPWAQGYKLEHAQNLVRSGWVPSLVIKVPVTP